MSSHAPEPPLGDGAARARVFQGGTYLDLHKMLGVTSGSQVLPYRLPSVIREGMVLISHAARPGHWCS